MAVIPNRTLTCYILDDEEHMIKYLSELIDETDGLNLAGTSTRPLEALPFFANPEAPDIVFLGMYMNGMYGTDFALAVKNNTQVVFTTSMPWRVQKIFPVEPFEYLPKPIDNEAFNKCIQRIRRRKNSYSL